EESVEHVSSMAGRFARWALEDEAKFSYLLDMSKHDFYTATHMLNVGVGCGLLAARVRPGEEQFLADVVQGGLLHDVGKRAIDPEILNKEKDLSPQEWRQLQQHPVAGFEQLREAGNASRIALQMTRWHHERLDGKGYPDALPGQKIPFSARLCAVVDAYDALTSGRPYRQAIAPLDALAMLQEGVGTQFDPDLFAAWREVVEGLIEADPQRTFHRPADEPAPQLTLDDIFPEVPLDARREEEAGQQGSQQNDRRAHVRLPVQVPVVATFLHQCKPYPVPVGKPWEAQTLDCSQGGACLLTPWPLARGDVLEVQLRVTSKDGRERVVRRYAVVRNVHQRGDDAWTAGVRFVENPQDPYRL
ncbi:MAG: HD domain-containing protein, partial [Planctomycetota bacterium]